MNKVLRLGSLTTFLIFLVVVGLVGADDRGRVRASSTGVLASSPVSCTHVRLYASSFGSDDMVFVSKSPSSMYMFMSQRFDAERLLDPRQFIACIKGIFDEDDAAKLHRDLDEILLLLPNKSVGSALGSVFYDEADDEFSIEKAAVEGRAREMSVEDFWHYCYENEIFSAIKKSFGVMERRITEAMSLDLLSTSVSSGCRMMGNRDGLVARNKAVIAFIEARETEVSMVLGSAEKE